MKPRPGGGITDRHAPRTHTVADAYFGLKNGNDMLLEVLPTDAVVQMEADTSLRVLLGLAYDSESVFNMTLAVGEKGDTELSGLGVASPLYDGGYTLQDSDWILSSTLALGDDTVYDVVSALALGPGDSIHAFLQETELIGVEYAAMSEWVSGGEAKGVYKVGLSSESESLLEVGRGLCSSEQGAHT